MEICDFKDCGSNSPKVAMGWIIVEILQQRKHFCCQAHAIYYISDPLKYDADPDDTIKQTNIAC